MLAASSEAARDGVLAELGIRWPLPLADDEGKPLPPWQLESVSVKPMALANVKPEDFWVEIRFSETDPSDAPGQAVRSAAIVKLADGGYCALEGPSGEQRFADHGCLYRGDHWPVAFYFQHVVDKDRMTLLAESSSGRCASGCGRSSQSSVTFLDPRPFELAEVFTDETLSASYSGCPRPPTSWTEGRLEWVGSPPGTYPRDILAADLLRCAPEFRGPDDAETCTPAGKETRYRFGPTGYEPVEAHDVKMPVGADFSTELLAGGADDGSGRTWAGRCYKEMGDGKLDEAEADCRHALARASDKEVLASAWFNLALVAEKRPDAVAACAALKESLAIRPNNAVTRSKRDELCP